MFVNPPRLTDFKQILTKAGFQVSFRVEILWFNFILLFCYMQAEFSGGVLVCNGVVAVRKVVSSLCSYTVIYHHSCTVKLGWMH